MCRTPANSAPDSGSYADSIVIVQCGAGVPYNSRRNGGKSDRDRKAAIRIIEQSHCAQLQWHSQHVELLFLSRDNNSRVK